MPRCDSSIGKRFLERASDGLHSLCVYLSLCKCHGQSRNARLLCFFWLSRVLQQNKRRYFHKHCADVRHAWDLAPSSLMQDGPHVSHYEFVMVLKADATLQTREICHHVLLNTCFLCVYSNILGFLHSTALCILIGRTEVNV